MRPTPVLSLSLSLLVAGIAVTSCGAPGARSGSGGAQSPTAGSFASPGVARPARKAKQALPAPTPPPRVSTPMKGEPAAKALAEARLQSETCEQATNEGTDALVKRMRADVDAEFKNWHDGQMECWQADREESRYRR